jgi:integrase/recombinase XerD
MATMSPLRRRMIEDMTVRNLSPATQQSYLYAVAKFSRHFGVPPAQLGTEQVRAYQLHLIAQKRSWSHINQVACALRFFYGVTLGQTEAVARIVSGREPEKLPPVLNPEELVRFLEAVAGLRNRVALTTAYAAGLRVGEVARLKVSAIDSPRMLIHVEHGKGGRDRYAMLSPRLLGVLRAYWRRARPGLWLFPGQEPGTRLLAPAPCRPPAGLRGDGRGSISLSRPTRSGTVSPLIFWRAGPTSGSFRFCSGMSSWRPRPVMRRSPQT